MNFLSHFYFETENTDPNMVLGVVLPDFIKNAQKDINLYPQKEAHLFESDTHQQSILKGWEKHIEVDRLFHSSDFFKTQTAQLKQILLPNLSGSPVKPFFLAHIGLELVLDHLLTIEGMVNINVFYDQLVHADKAALKVFLEKCGLTDSSVFFNFLNSFISSKYLFSYRKIENISYALNRICMRLWENPLNEIQMANMTSDLEEFTRMIKPDYLSIFREIEAEPGTKLS